MDEPDHLEFNSVFIYEKVKREWNIQSSNFKMAISLDSHYLYIRATIIIYRTSSNELSFTCTAIQVLLHHVLITTRAIQCYLYGIILDWKRLMISYLIQNKHIFAQVRQNPLHEFHCYFTYKIKGNMYIKFYILDFHVHMLTNKSYILILFTCYTYCERYT